MGCSNPRCHCQTEVLIERDGARYCSDSCASAHQREGEGCPCGHAGCSTLAQAEGSAAG
jgi:hypothetical protein